MCSFGHYPAGRIQLDLTLALLMPFGVVDDYFRRNLPGSDQVYAFFVLGLVDIRIKLRVFRVKRIVLGFAAVLRYRTIKRNLASRYAALLLLAYRPLLCNRWLAVSRAALLHRLHRLGVPELNVLVRTRLSRRN